ncbi:hypothetical protein [Streptomyces sp. CB03911]|uniref:hypothetical protein n=1 Tax=Streptomyces sp. CB03911 TaxID=1804758 RepID=UPI00093BBE49|nr:hypothetical protein [Streptomyces sp. CB03911]OKI19256.1 hypothetical protein A6A07_07080 [Streptomyces sp. CB03911]
MDIGQDDGRDTYQQAIERAMRAPEQIRQHAPTGHLVVVVRSFPATGNSTIRRWTLTGTEPEHVVPTAELEHLQHAFKASR